MSGNVVHYGTGSGCKRLCCVAKVPWMDEWWGRQTVDGITHCLGGCSVLGARVFPGSLRSHKEMELRGPIFAPGRQTRFGAQRSKRSSGR